MKVVYVLDDLYSFNAISKIVQMEAKGFVSLGWDVYIITSKSKSIDLDISGAKIIDLPLKKKERAVRFYATLKNPFLEKEFAKIVRNISPDVVHFHNIHEYFCFSLFKVARKYARRVFYTAHDVMSFHYGKLTEFLPRNIEQMRYDPDLMGYEFDYRVSIFQQIKRFKKRVIPSRRLFIRHYIGYLDRVFAVSNELRKALGANGIANTDVLYNPIDTDLYDDVRGDIDRFKDKYNLKNKKVVLFGGRISYQKGQNQIIKALIEILKKDKDVVLMVLGVDSVVRSKIMSLYSDLSDHLVLMEYLRGDDLKTAFLSSDLAVVPSIYMDPCPLIIMEAMAYKKPVVATCFGGAKEIVRHKETGYIVNPFNISELSECILDLLSDEKKREEFGKRGFENVRNNFSVEKHINNLVEHYTR